MDHIFSNSNNNKQDGQDLSKSSSDEVTNKAKIKNVRRIKTSRYDLTHSSNSIPSLHSIDEDEDEDGDEYEYYLNKSSGGDNSSNGGRSEDSDTTKIISEYFNRTFKKMMNRPSKNKRKSIQIQTISSSSENELDSDNNKNIRKSTQQTITTSNTVQEIISSEEDEYNDTGNSDNSSDSSFSSNNSDEEEDESEDSSSNNSQYSQDSEDSSEQDESSYETNSNSEDESRFGGGSDYEGYVENENTKIIKHHKYNTNTFNLKEVSNVINSCDDLIKQKKILFNMLLAENFMEARKPLNSTNKSGNVFNKKKLVTFAKNIMKIELSDISPKILKSNQFKTFYLNYYRDIFQKALNVTNLKYGKSKPNMNATSIIPMTITKYNHPKDHDLLLDMSYLNGHSQNTFFKRYDREFIEIESLGAGGFGSVFLVKKKSHYLDNQQYAIKKVNFSIVLGNSHSSTSSKLEKVFREVKSLSVLDHVNILRYFNAWVEIDTKSDTPKFSSVEGSMNTEEDDDEDDETTTNNDTSNTIEFSNTVGKFRNSMSIVPYLPLPNGGHASLSKTTSSITNDFIENIGINSLENSCNNTKTLKVPSPPLRIKYSLYIQTQYCEGKSLKEFIDDPSFPQQPKLLILNIFKQIIVGLQYIHSMNIIHRDIKPANIFIHNEIIKIGDFGLAKEFSYPNNHQPSPPEVSSSNRKSNEIIELNNSLVDLMNNTQGIGTQTYASPEQQTQPTYTNKVDIFSCGIILYELLYAFSTQSERVQHISDLKKSILPQTFIENFNEESKLILLLISQDPSQRPTAQEIIDIHLPVLLKKYQIQNNNNITTYESLDKETLVSLLMEKDQEILNLKNELRK